MEGYRVLASGHRLLAIESRVMAQLYGSMSSRKRAQFLQRDFANELEDYSFFFRSTLEMLCTSTLMVFNNWADC